jgi:DNA-binding transcriptional MerR regulator
MKIPYVYPAGSYHISFFAGNFMKQQGIKKLYYSISEVSKITDLEQYVLRYWESEFEQLKPAKNRAGNRIYTNKEIKLILYIKRLLRDERYTIEGAKQVLLSYIPDNDTGEQLELIDEVPVPAYQSSNPQPRPADNRLKNDMVELKRFLEELLVRLT